MSSNPKVTIGIPVYNGELYIKQAVESVLKQTFRDFQLIITDDGSTDGTISILNSFNDPRMVVIADGKNRGISYRLNQQIDKAEGAFFVRMDADDIMFPNRLEKEISFLEDNPTIDVVGTSAIVIDENNQILGRRAIQKDRFETPNSYFTCSRFIHPTVAGRTEWFRKWKYREIFSGNEDLELWIRSHNQSSFADITEPLLFYRDPYHFRLKTYYTRKKKYLRCVLQLRKQMNNAWINIPLFYLRALIGIAGALFFTLIRKEEKMISRRNQPINEQEKNKYHQILNSIQL